LYFYVLIIRHQLNQGNSVIFLEFSLKGLDFYT